MRIPTLSEIGKGKIFEYNDIMGTGENPIPHDEHWSENKEQEMINKSNNSVNNLSNKGVNLKAKMLAGKNKIFAGQLDAKTRLFNNKPINNNYNKQIFRGGNMYNKNYSKKVEDIMGKSAKSSKSNYQNKVSMVMGGSQKSKGGFNVNAFDMKAKSFLSMGGGGKMQNAAQKSKMLTASGGAPKSMNAYFSGAQKPKGNFNVNSLFSGSKSKVDINKLIGGAKSKGMPNLRPQTKGVGQIIMGAKNQSKINSMLGMQNIMGAKNKQASAMAGMYKQPEGTAWKRVNVQEKLNLFGDADGDKVANILDCEPMNKNAQGFWGNIGNAAKAVGGAIGSRIVPSQIKERKFDEERISTQRERELMELKYGGGIAATQVDSSSSYQKTVEGSPGSVESSIPTIDDKILGETKTKGGTTNDGYSSQVIRERKSKDIVGGDRLSPEQIELIKTREKAAEVADKQQKIDERSGIATQRYQYAELAPKGFLQRAQGAAAISKGQSEMMKAEAAITKSEADVIKANRLTGIEGKGKKAKETYGDALGQSEVQNTGMGFERMANIQTGSGNGFYQMLGSQRLQSQRANAFEQMAIAQEQSQPQMPEPMDEPEEEMGDIPQGKMVDGVEYIRLPSGKWRNSKTGQTVTYPRGKYND